MVKFKNKDFLLGIFLILLGVLIILRTNSFRDVSNISGVSGAFMPKIVAAGIIILAIFLIINSFTNTGKSRRFLPVKSERLLVMKFSILIFLYILLLPYLGFIISSTIFLFVIFTLLGGFSMYKKIFLSIITPTVIFIVFSYLLNVPLPQFL